MKSGVLEPNNRVKSHNLAFTPILTTGGGCHSNAIMYCITVTPSTSGQYWGKSQTVTFYPIIGFQYTTFHKEIDSKVRVIQCNMVNEEDL